MTKRLWVRAVSAVLAVIVGEGAPVRADVTIRAEVETVMSTGKDRIALTTFLKGPWQRRELRGEGALANLIGKTVEIQNRHTGVTFRLYPADRRYTIDTASAVACRPEAIVDTRLLGRIQAPLPARVSRPDTVLSLLGCTARPLQVELARGNQGYGGGTTVRFWMCRDYEGLFGAGYAEDLFCGAPDDTSSGLRELQERWRRQFRLSAADAQTFNAGLRGYPLQIETSSGAESARPVTSRITTLSVDTSGISDSLFSIPAGFAPLDAAGPAHGADSAAMRPSVREPN